MLDSALSQTPDYYRCNNRVSGEWNYGRAPSACDASAFGDDSLLKKDYPNLFFLDSAGRISERQRYMTELNALIKEAGSYYFKKRKPNANSEELNWWILGLQTLASQESFWSHYRIVPESTKIKMMRGDLGHGHGMMQIDDRAHFNAVERGIAWKLITNLTYGMDIFYSAWVNSATATCVSHPSNYTQRVRTAWAAYNGGPRSLCRWTNPNSVWARNDEGFLNNLNQKRWLAQITDPNKNSSVDVICLIENQENCAQPVISNPGQTNPETLLSQTLYTSNLKNKFCVIKNNQAQCVTDQRDTICLNQIDSVNINKLSVTEENLLNSYNPQLLDRHQLCSSHTPGLFKVGAYIKLNKSINLRATPAGGLQATIPLDSVVQIQDFEVRNQNLQDRYYKINYNNTAGYIYAGNKNDYAAWATQTILKPEYQFLAQSNQKIKIKNLAGINLRATAAGELILTIPRNTILTVFEIIVRESENKAYYKVKYQNKTGYIYTGLLLPTNTVKDWTEIIL